ncbi:hypothetical protein MPS_2509 [Mycobacterium pseudoshottsii JCM 15466]|nr:hypothetical protein MPS_2509 [Mycobacterium pseudoshottsii JCM 15466]
MLIRETLRKPGLATDRAHASGVARRRQEAQVAAGGPLPRPIAGREGTGPKPPSGIDRR